MAQLRRAVREIFRTASESPAVRAARAPRLRLPPSFSPASPVQSRLDEWATLHDLHGEDAQRLLKQEDAAAQAFFADTAGFEAGLQAEAARLLSAEAEDAPEVHGPFRYFHRYTPEGFVVFCRAPTEGGPVEVLLDTGQLASETDAGFADVPVCKVSDDHAVLAFVVDLVGDESYELRLRGMGPDAAPWAVRLPGVKSMEFLGGEDGRGALHFLAVHLDGPTRRACRIAHHTVRPGETVGSADVLWDERNEAAYLEVFRTKDRKYVLLSSNTKDTSEVRAVRCHTQEPASSSPASPTGAERLLAPREGVEYFAEHRAGVFYVVSNHERPDFSVYRLPAAALGHADGGWGQLSPFFTPPGGLHVTDADLLRDWLVLYGHDAAEPRICVVPMGGGGVEQPTAYLASLPAPVGSVEPGVNAEPDADSVRFTFRSPLEPGATYSLDLASKAVQLVRRREWASTAGLGPEAFSCERFECPARDGVLIPLTLARPRRDGGQGTAPRPCLVHVYGAYGTCLAPDFRPEHVALLRRGWVVAWAHVRGGGERGRAWHAAARQLGKAQSVLDLADCLHFLLARGIAAPGALCVKAASAGGLTLGALLNSPRLAGVQLLAGAVLEVPFVDVLTGMSDPSLPLTVHEFAEWGDPRDPVHEANLRSLSPYENVGFHSYPRLYLSCARADSRVPPWMALKFAARVRARAPAYLEGPSLGGARRHRRAAAVGDAAEAPCVVVHCSDGGHSGASDWHGRSEEFARQLAFLQKAVGLPLE